MNKDSKIYVAGHTGLLDSAWGYWGHIPFIIFPPFFGLLERRLGVIPTHLTVEGPWGHLHISIDKL